MTLTNMHQYSRSIDEINMIQSYKHDYNVWIR